LDIGTQQLSIPNELFQRVPIAVEILSSIVEVKTPLEKVWFHFIIYFVSCRFFKKKKTNK